MIREFIKSDLDNFKPNKFSKYEDYKEIFDDDECLKFSLIKNNKVAAIMCFHCYWGNNWQCFILIEENFKRVYMRHIKNFMDFAIGVIKPSRLSTDSIDCDLVNRFHKFLGFKLEGTREKYIYDENINMWAMIWE